MLTDMRLLVLNYPKYIPRLLLLMLRHIPLSAPLVQSLLDNFYISFEKMKSQQLEDKLSDKEAYAKILRKIRNLNFPN